MVTVTNVWQEIMRLLHLALSRGTATIGVTASRAFGIFTTVVPAATFRNLGRLLTNQGFRVENLSLGASKLVGIPSKEAGEEELAVVRMGEDGMSLEEPVRSDLFLSGASEPVNGLEDCGITSI